MCTRCFQICKSYLFLNVPVIKTNVVFVISTFVSNNVRVHEIHNKAVTQTFH